MTAMSRRISFRSGARAMTLLELLVATAIFSTLISALYIALFSGVRLRETAWNNFESGIERVRIAKMLREDLTNIVVPAGILSGPLLGQSGSENNQRHDTLEFFATTGGVTDAEPWGEFQKIEYFLEEPEDGARAAKNRGYDFVRRVRRDLTATVVNQQEVPEARWRLLSGVRAFIIEYYDGTSWIEAWDTTTQENKNPAGVRMRFEFEPDDDGRMPSPLVIVSETAPQPRPTPAAAGSQGGVMR